MKDRFGRSIDYMRISVTDCCNLRCRYCIPEDMKWMPLRQLLTYEEIETVCRCGAKLGISKLKITGGEPLMRRDIAVLVGMLKAISGIECVTLTTNGVLLADQVEALKASGLDAVNISLDTLDAMEYERITGKNELEQVLAGIHEAIKSGMKTKINVVLQQDIHGQSWKKLVELAREEALDVRFIEMMPIGAGLSVPGISGKNLYERIREEYPHLQQDMSVHGNGPAVYYRIPGFIGSIGFINAIHGVFCDTCNRIRMSATGEIKPCLCYESTIDLKPFLKKHDRTGIQDALRRGILQKPRSHCFDQVSGITERNNMAVIGG